MSTQQIDNAWIGRFDGGARKGVASGGYLLFDDKGAMRAGESLYFGTYTNNEAEAMACQALIQQLALNAPQGGTVIIEGDSKLILSFLQRAAKPNKKSLVKLVAAMRKNLLLLPCNVVFRFIPREQNAACDWLAQQALLLKRSANLGETGVSVQLGSAPPLYITEECIGDPSSRSEVVGCELCSKAIARRDLK